MKNVAKSGTIIHEAICLEMMHEPGLALWSVIELSRSAFVCIVGVAPNEQWLGSGPAICVHALNNWLMV